MRRESESIGGARPGACCRTRCPKQSTRLLEIHLASLPNLSVTRCRSAEGTRHRAREKRIKMRIVNLDGNTPPYDVASGLGQALIQSKVAKLYEPPRLERSPNTAWLVVDGSRVDDYQYPPEIAFSCSSCGNKGRSSGPTVEQSQKFSHCGIHEQVPAAIKKEFRTRRDKWNKLYLKKGQTPTVRVEYGKQSVHDLSDDYLRSIGRL